MRERKQSARQIGREKNQNARKLEREKTRTRENQNARKPEREKARTQKKQGVCVSAVTNYSTVATTYSSSF
jgi:hypothetical protein